MAKSKKLEKWVPHELNEYQKKNHRYEICCASLSQKNYPFFNRTVTSDEKWILYDNQRCSVRWLDRGEALKHFPKAKLYQKKVLATVWRSINGIIHYNLDSGEAITVEKYCQEIDKIHQEQQRLRPALLNKKGPIFLYDNYRPHVSQMAAEIEQPGLRDSTLLNLLIRPLSHRLSLFQASRQLPARKGIQQQRPAQNAFEELIDSRTPEFYATGINRLVSCWYKCVDSSSFYFD
uniref:Mariner Mos1 transposase n=1 Tax=Heterorhabditis bacteriophora TaxID=37862 RepID=A0A1I7X3J3_HETBA